MCSFACFSCFLQVFVIFKDCLPCFGYLNFSKCRKFAYNLNTNIENYYIKWNISPQLLAKKSTFFVIVNTRITKKKTIYKNRKSNFLQGVL